MSDSREPTETRADQASGLWGLRLGAMLAAASLATVHAYQIWHGGFPSDYAWVSAHHSLMAQNFVEHGPLGLGLVPLQSYAPLGAVPDVYLHWPPLFNLLLALCFAIFGSSPAVAQCLVLAIQLGNAVLIFLLGRELAGPRAGYVAALFFLITPVVTDFSFVVVPVFLALQLVLVAAYALLRLTRPGARVRLWSALALVSLAAGTMASWEAATAAPGFLIGALLVRDRTLQRQALIAVLVAGLAGALVLMVYGIAQPQLMRELVDTVLYRMGVRAYQPTSSDLNTFWRIQHYTAHSAPWSQMILIMGAGLVRGVGLPGLCALVVALIGALRGAPGSRSRGAAAVLTTLATPLLIWSALLPAHVCDHAHQLTLIVPACSLALGLIFTWAIASTLGSRLLRRAVLVALLLSGTWLGVRSIERSSQAAGLIARGVRDVRPEVAQGLEIRSLTPPGSVVASPLVSMATIYFSQRRLIRGVVDDLTWERMQPEVAAQFPDSQIYLYLPHPDLPRFARTLGRNRAVRPGQLGWLVGMPPASQPVSKRYLND